MNARSLRMLVPVPALLAALVGCETSELPAYYTGSAPTVDTVEPALEQGNMGGQTITLRGANLGTDPANLVVTIGSHNATIVEANGDSLVVVTPAGPLSGGPVDVVVATADGYVWKDDLYTYNVVIGDGASPYDGQTAYISIENLWTSCLGGMWDHGSDDLNGAGCETIAYVGTTGIQGSSEWWKSPWARGHADQVGWVGNTDFQAGGWKVQSSYVMNGVSGYEDLRKRVGDVSLTNEVWSGERQCIDPLLDPADNGANCGDGSVAYELDTLRFCETFDAETGGTQRYSADWMIAENFFQASEDSDDHFNPVTVQLHVGDKNVGLDGTEITLPGAMQVRATRGFGDSESDAVAWAAMGTTDRCLDADGDGSATLDEAGVVLEWNTIEDPSVLGGPDVSAQQTYVMVSVTWLPLDWFGLAPGGPRASIVVPDTGRLEIPNSVLYQFPSPNFDYASVSDITNEGNLGTWDDNAAYLLIEAYRYTDYKLDDRTGEAPVVLSYVTGDLSFVAGWDNPTERADDCDDCLDGDGDGWTDDLDPDCQKDGVGSEINATSDSTCNDGEDNDDNGLVDSEDPLCEDGSDGETTCDDGEDNDGDGWADSEDSECIAGGELEAGDDDPSATCSDGIDNDGDGWVDGLDPACTKGDDTEDDGFAGLTSGAQCNDGLDNDGHGDIDAADPYCWDLGPATLTEEPAALTSECADGEDNNDDDGFIDGMDPDCDVRPRTRELTDFWEVGDDHPVVPACYDGLDNDGDGAVDAADPSCWSPSAGFVANGFLNDEGKSWATGCTDGLDGDGDGWIDAKDPDCAAGSPDTQVEVGLSTHKCNDGISNGDGDDLIDANDPGCRDGFDEFENN